MIMRKYIRGSFIHLLSIVNMAPPGITHLPSLLRILLLPPLVVHLSLRLAHLGQVGPWVHALALFLSYPAWFFCTRLSSAVYRRWRANKLGAVLAPSIRESSWAIIQRFTKELSKGYPGINFTFSIARS